MMRGRINLCNSSAVPKKRGIRCQVCTGCGRCPGVEGVHILTENRWKPEVNLHNDRQERLITVDVGTTTIAMQLHRADGSVEDSFVAVNPQTEYGADVISRISAAQWQGAAEREGEQQKPDAAVKMQGQVLETLEKGVSKFRKRILPQESLRMVLAANTTMVYLLMGWNTEELGRAPFCASHLEEVETEIAGVPCLILPGLSAFVGGDIVAGICATQMSTATSPRLLIDLGTNGEMALGNREKIYACATAAGPAFEGGVNRGVWGADMVKLLATLRREGMLDETGLLTENYFETGIRIGNVCVTQEAVRAVQLAKAAIATGIEILLKDYGCTCEDVEQVILAGGFGYYLNPMDAAEIGLLPGKLVHKTVSGGNTALAGALCIGEEWLKREPGYVKKIRNPECNVKIINLANQLEFENVYFAAMNLQSK